MGEALLAPTVIYVPRVLSLAEAVPVKVCVQHALTSYSMIVRHERIECMPISIQLHACACAADWHPQLAVPVLNTKLF